MDHNYEEEEADKDLVEDANLMVTGLTKSLQTNVNEISSSGDIRSHHMVNDKIDDPISSGDQNQLGFKLFCLPIHICRL